MSPSGVPTPKSCSAIRVRRTGTSSLNAAGGTTTRLASSVCTPPPAAPTTSRTRIDRRRIVTVMRPAVASSGLNTVEGAMAKRVPSVRPSGSSSVRYTTRSCEVASGDVSPPSRSTKSSKKSPCSRVPLRSGAPAVRVTSASTGVGSLTSPTGGVTKPVPSASSGNGSAVPAASGAPGIAGAGPPSPASGISSANCPRPRTSPTATSPPDGIVTSPLATHEAVVGS